MISHSRPTQLRLQLAGIGVLAAAATAAFWIGEGPASAAQAAGIILAFAGVVAVMRRRSPTAETIGGIGDERTRALYRRAEGIAGSALIYLIIGWWLVTVALGDPNQTLSLLGAVGGAAFLVAAAVLTRRG